MAATLFTELKSDPRSSRPTARRPWPAIEAPPWWWRSAAARRSTSARASQRWRPGSTRPWRTSWRSSPLPTRPLRKLCIPTTSGTGSETTRTAILTRADHAKVWLWGDELKADAVILDPELTVSLPAPFTAATGIDALVHAVEAATNRNANPLADLYAHEAIRLVAANLHRALEAPGDLAAREAMQRAAALAGIAIDNCGTAIAHAIGHAMGSLAGIPHGRAVGVAMLASLPWTMAEGDERFGACAAAMGAEPTAAGFRDAYERLVRASGMMVSVRNEFAGVSAEAFAAQIARPENAAMRASTRRGSSDADLLALAQAVLDL